MMTVERLREFGAAWGRGDVDALMSYMTDDCVYSASVGPEPGKTYVGREAVRAGFEELLAFDAGGESREGEAWVHGDRGVAEWSYVHTGDDGATIETKGCDLFRFEGDLIAVKDAYRKTTAS